MFSNNDYSVGVAACLAQMYQDRQGYFRAMPAPKRH